MTRSTATLLGYDGEILRRLPEAQRRQLERVATGWLSSCCLLAAPVAYSAFLVEHSLWLSALLFVAAFLVLWNVLRLLVAGGGAPPHTSRAEVQRYRPALASTVLLASLAILLAQPAQLPLARAVLDAPVAQRRQQLVESHLLATRDLGLDDDGSYEASLVHAEFVVMRLAWLWRDPWRALGLTALYTLLILTPALGARWAALDALRRYELSRWERDRRAIVQEAHATDQAVDAILRGFASYTPQARRYAAPPFDTVVVSPDLLPQEGETRRGA